MYRDVSHNSQCRTHPQVLQKTIGRIVMNSHDVSEVIYFKLAHGQKVRVQVAPSSEDKWVAIMYESRRESVSCNHVTCAVDSQLRSLQNVGQGHSAT